MNEVTVSSKYQVVIPLKVRRMLGIKPEQKMHVLVLDNQRVLVPVHPVSAARGSLSGIDTDVRRENVE